MSEFTIILILILINGIFSMAEMAVVSARKARLLQQSEDGNENARAAYELAESPNRFLSTIQIGITLIGTLTGAVGGASLSGDLVALLNQSSVPFIAQNAQGIGLALIVLLITYLSLVFGELAPKRLALSNPEGIASAMARPMAFFARLTTPAAAVLDFSTEIVMKLLRVKASNNSAVTPEEITVMMEQGESLGLYEERETDIVEAVFRLGDLRAGSLMTPRTEIDWIDLEDGYDDIVQDILSSSHSHFPVAEGGLDAVTGVLRSKDILARMLAGQRPEISELALPAQFIPESMPAFEVLELLRSTPGNLALVIDEFGGMVGMITLFDVMRAVVGGISERGEPVQPEAVQREDGSWLVEGMIRIDTFKDLFDLDSLPEEERAGYQTLGGFVMAQIGSVPEAGQSFTCCGLKIEVLDMDGLRVDKVLVSREEG